MRERQTGRTAPQIVKFGGSLFEAEVQAGLLDVAARHGVVLVPGGGPFADAVRREQTRAGFSDRAAHAMAILAMDQTAFALADAEPRLELCCSPEAFDRALLRGSPAIWRPSPMALAADLPASWEVTSDSLALWLAIELGASRLVLLKAADVAANEPLALLAATGVVDPHLPRLASRFAGEIAVVGPASAEALEAALAAPLRRAA